eukprot:3937861-Rhodomonas_salina.1
MHALSGELAAARTRTERRTEARRIKDVKANASFSARETSISLCHRIQEDPLKSSDFASPIPTPDPL